MRISGWSSDVCSSDLLTNICIHKGLFSKALEKRYPHLRRYADVSDVAKAAKDWPQLNFLICHAGYRHVGGQPGEAWAERSEDSRGGKECVSTSRARGSPVH